MIFNIKWLIFNIINFIKKNISLFFRSLKDKILTHYSFVAFNVGSHVMSVLSDLLLFQLDLI